MPHLAKCSQLILRLQSYIHRQVLATRDQVHVQKTLLRDCYQLGL